VQALSSNFSKTKVCFLFPVRGKIAEELFDPHPDHPNRWLTCRISLQPLHSGTYCYQTCLLGKEPATSIYPSYYKVSNSLGRCGNLGHFAETCTSDERYVVPTPLIHIYLTCLDSVTTVNNLVMNQMLVHSRERQVHPSTNPYLSPLLTPFLEAKQCYHCQGIGHVQSDCPSLRIARQVCSGPDDADV
jgi:hypothetical protein